MHYSILIYLFLFGCDQAETYKKAFKINEDHIKVDLNSIQTIKQFDDLYCEGNSIIPLILPYDFENSRFDQNSNFGIPVIGDPRLCHSSNCCKHALTILVKDESTWYYDNDIKIDKEDLDSLVRLNILNNGYDPSLSDNPNDALFLIKADENTQLSDLNLILGEISSAYLNILKDKFPEIDKSDGIEVYPLNLIITSFVENPLIPVDTIFHNEIKEALKIDVNGDK